jgi:alkyl hydroperoxide reductase subunit AhpC
MSTLIGEEAPNFSVESTSEQIDFHQWIDDSWAFFSSHPADHTPICTTEMGRTAQIDAEFELRNVKPMDLSPDTVEEHKTWILDVNRTQDTNLTFPAIADADFVVAKRYQMIHPTKSETAAVRSAFIFDPNKKIRLTMTCPMNISRNFDEMPRGIYSVQLGDAKKVATPTNWRPGQKVIIPPSMDSEEAKNIIPQEWDELRPYFRLTEV